MDALHSVSVAKVAELLDLNNLTKEMNLKERAIAVSYTHLDVYKRQVILSGTRPPKSSRSILMQALISRALLFPRPNRTCRWNKGSEKSGDGALENHPTRGEQ